MKYGLVYLGGLLAVLAAGCSSDDIALEPTHATYSYEQVKDQEIALPANYNKNNYRKLLLGVAVNDIGVKAGEISPNVVQTLSTRAPDGDGETEAVFGVFGAQPGRGAAVPVAGGCRRCEDARQESAGDGSDPQRLHHRQQGKDGTQI